MLIQITVTNQMIKACKAWVSDVNNCNFIALKRVTEIKTTGFLWWKKDVEVESIERNYGLKLPPLCRLIDIYYNNSPALHASDSESTITAISELTPQVVHLSPNELRDINLIMEYYSQVN